ncbi:14036_t:CDS:1 [Ambispora leptoticha]|uniref:14036_t:CDS:1 n=1 Tax=Ambispora leptoticha TaxID=144679 RepID=A0A9N8ZJ13_9GLOM|nr:14036_t:CDS:1 [Ambispora leptoticha]
MTKIKKSTSGSDKVRSAFTAEEDAHLQEYIIQKKSEGAALSGNMIYKVYQAPNNRHTWQSIRNRAIKNIIPQLLANEAAGQKTQPRIHQNLLSKSEQETLRIYLLAQRNNREGLYGYIIYQQYPALDEHSWETIREYAIKYIIPYLPEGSQETSDSMQTDDNNDTHEFEELGIHVEIGSIPEVSNYNINDEMTIIDRETSSQTDIS